MSFFRKRDREVEEYFTSRNQIQTPRKELKVPIPLVEHTDQNVLSLVHANQEAIKELGANITELRKRLEEYTHIGEFKEHAKPTNKMNLTPIDAVINNLEHAINTLEEFKSKK